MSAPLWLRLMVGATLLLGIFFRFDHLDNKVFWDDEVIGTVRLLGHTEADVVAASPQFTTAADLQRYLQPPSTLRLGDTVRALGEDPQHPPLYYVLERVWVQLFGSTPASERSLAAIFGVLVLPCIGWLAFELFGSLTVALVAVALVAVSPLYVLYAQEAREYMAWMCAVAVDGALLLRAARSNALGLWIAYALATVVGMYVFPLTGFVALGFAVYLVFRERFRPTRALVACVLANAIALVAFVPWLRVWTANPALMRELAGLGTTRPTVMSFVGTAGRQLRAPFVDLALSWVGTSTGTVTNLVLTVLVVALLIVALRALIRDWPFAVWGFVVIGFFLLFAPFDFKGENGIEPRYLFPFLLGLQLAVAAFLSGLIFARAGTGARAPRTGTATLAVLLLAEVASCALSAGAQTQWTKDYENSRIVAAGIGAAPKPILVGDALTMRMLALSVYLDPKVPVRVRLQCERCTLPPVPAPDLENTAGYETVFALEVPGTTNASNVRWIDPRAFPRTPDPLNLFLSV
jgi:uncharacterized membrane protein